jgi:tetratricopeptide (TPR) repeat protein
MMISLNSPLPKDPKTYLGYRVVRVLTLAFLLIIVVRSLIHLFSPDGGAQSIAGIDTTVAGGNNIIAILIEESPREAIYMLTRLTIQNPQRHYLFASIALAYEKMSDYNSAIKNYTKALELDYGNMNYCYNLGVLYDQNKEYEKALEMYSNVVKNNDSSNLEIALDSVKRRIEKIKQMI